MNSLVLRVMNWLERLLEEDEKMSTRIYSHHARRRRPLSSSARSLYRLLVREED